MKIPAKEQDLKLLKRSLIICDPVNLTIKVDIVAGNNLLYYSN